MANANYPACIAKVLAYEGGYSNHPKDPGGVTLEGVIQTTYDSYRRSKGLPRKALLASMRSSPDWQRERNEIYRRHYWDPVKGDALRPGEDLALFDYGVNSGPSRAAKVLQRIVGVAVDGAIGPETLKATQAKFTAVGIVKAVCQERMGFLRGLRTWGSFGKGWTRRVVDTEAVGVRMALQSYAGASPEKVQEGLKKEASAATQKAAKSATGAGATTAGAGGVAPHVPSDWGTFETLLAFGIGAVVIGVVVFCAVKAYQNHQRAKAYDREIQAAA